VVTVLSYASLSDVEAYVSKYAYYIDNYQLLNEIDALKWASGNLYMDEEILKMISDLNAVVKKYDQNARTLTTFTATAMITRFNLVQQASNLVDVVGVDIYETSINMFEQIYYYLQRLSGKPVWVTEFGSANPDDNAQANYLVNCLNKFEKCGVQVAIIFAWNQCLQAIANRQAEKAVKEWILREA
jgi:exo-beta-1,3-glucanase (GH17 family)